MARLKKVTEDFIKKEDKREKRKGVNTQSNQDTEKKRQNLHLSKQTIEILWLNRAKTGETLSETVDRLVLDHLGKK